MTATRFQFGDNVRHVKRPEWGIGQVIKVEEVPANGHPVQRLTVRFPNAGLKTLNSGAAELEIVRQRGEAGSDDEATFHDLERMGKSEWLAPVAQRKIDEMMLGLPMAVRDVFRPLESRLKVLLDLYRFDRSGRGLVDWAVAQSGLDDPLTRFNRHELEQLFDRWVHERDAQLAKLAQEATESPGLVRKLLEQAPPAARVALQRLSVAR
jgi:hypothetical protein